MHLGSIKYWSVTIKSFNSKYIGSLISTRHPDPHLDQREQAASQAVKNFIEISPYVDPHFGQGTKPLVNLQKNGTDSI